VYFYELHEGDDDLYSDVILAREDEVSPEDFFDLVQSIRRRIQDGFAEDTLIEAIAVELERDHDFIFVSDERISAAVNVSTDEDDNFLLAGEDEFEAMGLAGADYRRVFADLETGSDGDDASRLN